MNDEELSKEDLAWETGYTRNMTIGTVARSTGFCVTLKWDDRMHEASKHSHERMVERLKQAQAEKSMSTPQPTAQSPV